MKKRKIGLMLLTALILTGCAGNGQKPSEDEFPPINTVTPVPTEDDKNTEEQSPDETNVHEEENNVYYSKVKVDETKIYQTWESFGASAAWWAQYVGGWDKKNDYSVVTPRDDIATLLYDREKGIGLNAYRYNLGAGSAESGKGTYWDPHRRAQCFETEAGVYDWSKDANAVWFMQKAVELSGGDMEVILFCNSPLERLTKSGKAQSLKNSKTNIDPANYDEFASYCFDVAEHFISMGIPVKEISPVNEPQWEWLDSQEGMHLENDALVGILEAFVKGIKERSALSDVRISGPESGEWGGKTKEYISAIMSSPLLKEYFTTIDCHSYWTNKSTKVAFKNWIDSIYPGITLRTSEWCEMVNGSDYTMDSAFNMADVIMEDMKVLDVTSWQLWVAVSPGGYRDGLIHVNEEKQAYRATRRLWALGNFSRFIRPGYVRTEVSTPYTDIYNMGSVAFTGVNENNENELVVVLTNEEDKKSFRMDITGTIGYNTYEVYTTTEEKDLLLTASGKYDPNTVITIEGQSVVTLKFTARQE